jgi:hypothetical protein
MKYIESTVHAERTVEYMQNAQYIQYFYSSCRIEDVITRVVDPDPNWIRIQ